jgi:dihydropteroate synthase
VEIWGIINLTPDSFVPESRIGKNKLLNTALNFLQQGADVLDIGAESTKPYSEPISEEEEWERLESSLQELKILLQDSFSKQVSIDTYKTGTVQKCLEMGIRIVNDISTGSNDNILSLVSFHQAKIVLMHSLGSPKTMQEAPHYTNVVEDVYRTLSLKTEIALKHNIAPENIIWDYGIGFGKTMEHNLALIANTRKFKTSGFPLMAGISRKSFLHHLLNIPDVKDRRRPGQVFHTYLALQGVDIIRVHDIEDSVEIRTIVSTLKQFENIGT